MKTFLIGHSEVLTEAEVKAVIQRVAAGAPPEKLIQLLMWYGFLGIPDAAAKPAYMYDRQYDLKRLAEKMKQGQDILFVINPAFRRGLQ